jgi:hypothetical protein
MGKITNVLRELVFPLSLLLTIIGIIMIILSAGFFWLKPLVNSLSFIMNLGEWNAYILVVGLVVFGVGVYYLYSYLKRSRFVVKEMKTNKRSEIQGKHNELRRTVKHLPSKYQKMLQAKEDELNIK